MWNQIAQNLSYRMIRNFAYKRDSPLQINCENFIMGCTVSFWAVLDQRLPFTTLEENWTALYTLFKHSLMWHHVSCVWKQVGVN